MDAGKCKEKKLASNGRRVANVNLAANGLHQGENHHTGI